MTNKEIIDALESHVRRLMKQNSDALEQLAKLQKANDEQAMKIRSLQVQSKLDREEIAKLRLGEAMVGSGRDKSAARAQVNRLLREVDKCIELVSDKIQ